MRSDLRTSVPRARVKSDTVTSSRPVHFDLPRVRLEARRSVFSGDAALNGESSSVNVVLGQTELLKGGPGSNLDLSCHNVDTGDLFRDGVLDLDTRVDLDKVVTALLVHEEFGGTCVPVLDRLGELESIGENGIADGLVKVWCRGNFDDLESAKY